MSDAPSARLLLPERSIGGVVLLLLGVFLPADPAAGQQPPPTTAAAPVVAEPVQVRDVVMDRSFVGTVTPTRTSIVGSTVEGRVIEFLVQEGHFVQQGQVLAQIRRTTLEIELAGARAELMLLQEQLEDLNLSQPEEIKQAEARMRAAKALQEYASRQLERGKSLVTRSAITADQLEEMVSAADSAANVLVERTSAYELAVTLAPLKRAQAEARIQVQQEIIHGLEDAISEHSVVAPFDGFVTREHTQVGQWIAKGGSVVELIELNEVEIEIPVLETFISELLQCTESQQGTRTLAIEVDALPGEDFTGEIVSIIPQADTQSRTFPVKVRVPNRQGPDGQYRLRTGMFARVTLPVKTVREALMVPKDALVLGQGLPIVWVVEPGPGGDAGNGDRVRPVAVQVGFDVSDGTVVQVVGPLAADGSLPLRPGEYVVTEGNERVNPGTIVKVTRREPAS
ncbi:MAG: efflux RND transporter periplasmic adaptor subunit [Pirellulaceae bacterium]|jgi:RND family efflux transporter MFP subunit|nr:efflux RND transporter periplasmic adaptor subunit [Pirellulaceae bacterium]